MRGEKKKEPKCGETERDTGRSMEALVARLPRMLSDSGRLMTGSRGHSESERAGATLQTGAPLSLGQSTQAAQPAPPAATGGGRRLPSHPSIHSSLHLCCPFPFPSTIPTLNNLDKHEDKRESRNTENLVSHDRAQLTQSKDGVKSSSSTQRWEVTKYKYFVTVLR